jgi:hypothetical protein
MSWYPSVEDSVNDLNIESDGNIINNNDNTNVCDDNNNANDGNNNDDGKHDDDDYINNNNDNNDDMNEDDFDYIKNNNDESSQSLVQDIISEFSFQEFNTEIYGLNDSNISENSNDNDNNADTSHECESVELLHSTSEFSLNANAPDFTFKQFDGYRCKTINSCLNSDTYRYGLN